MANAMNRKPRNDNNGPTTILRVLNISGLKPFGSLLPPPLIKRYPNRINTIQPPINQKFNAEKGFSFSEVFWILRGSDLISCFVFNATVN